MMISTALVTLAAAVFCMGMGANASAAEIRTLKLQMLGLSSLGASGIAMGMFLMRSGAPGWGAVAAAVPIVIMFSILIAALIR